MNTTSVRSISGGTCSSISPTRGLIMTAIALSPYTSGGKNIHKLLPQPVAILTNTSLPCIIDNTALHPTDQEERAKPKLTKFMIDLIEHTTLRLNTGKPLQSGHSDLHTVVSAELAIFCTFQIRNI